MTLSYSTTLQDQIAYRLHNKAYSTLQPSDKAAIDGTWTSGALATGHAFDAQALLRRYNNFLDATGSAQIPDDWSGWFLWETAWRAAAHMQPERAPDLKKFRDDALRQAITTYTQTGYDATATTVGWVVNHANIRKHVLDVCVHQEEILLPTPERIDAAMRARFVQMWNMAFWPFRREQITVTLPTSGQPTYSTSNTVDAITSTRLYFNDTSGKGSCMESVPGDDMAYLKSQGYDAGRPHYFRITKTAGTLYWDFDRTPDQSYTVKAEIATATPALATAANMDTALGKLPPEFLDLLRESVAADVMASYGRPRGYELVRWVNGKWDQYLMAFDDPGHHDEREAEAQSLGTIADLISGQGPLGWGGVGNIMGGQV